MGRHVFLLQVKDEDRLLHWHSLFENKQGNTFTTGSISNILSSPSGVRMMLAQNRHESDQTLQATLRGYQSTASSNGGKWDDDQGAKKVSMDDGDAVEGSSGGYFLGVHSTAYLHEPLGRHLHPLHRHSASAYTIANFTASPRGSQDEEVAGNILSGERPMTMVETSSTSRQMMFGPLDPRLDPATRDP